MGTLHDADIVIGAGVDTTEAEKDVKGLSDNLGEAMDSGVKKADNASAEMSQSLAALTKTAQEMLNQVGQAASSAIKTIASAGAKATQQISDTQTEMAKGEDSARGLADGLGAVGEGADQAGTKMGGLGDQTKDTGTQMGGLGDQTEDTGTKMGGLGAAINAVNRSLSEAQSAYSVLTQATAEYNKTGTMALGTWQALLNLDPKYQALLTMQSGKLAINTEAYNDLIASQRREITALMQQNGASEETISMLNKLGETTTETAHKTGALSTIASTVMKNLGVGSASFAVAAGNLISQAIQGIISSVKNMVSTVVSTGMQFNAQMENYELAFQNLLGDAQAAEDALDAIKQDAAATPFDVSGLVAANRLLLSTGQSAEEARKVINALGNAVSASGGGNAELQRMAANLQQIANVGKASTIDIRQFAYAGIDIYGILADYTGKTKEEVQKMTVTYDLLTAALEAASNAGGRYAGAMEAYSQTLQGRMDTLSDNAAQLAGALTEGLFKAQGELVSAAAGWVDTLSETLQSEGPGAMAAAGVQIIFEFAQGAISSLPQVVNAAVQTVAGFITGVIQNLPAIASSGGQMIGSLIAGLLGMMANIEVAVLQIVEAIIDFFLSGDFISVGIQFIAGIIQGFVDALPDLVNTVISAVGKLVDKAKQLARDGWNSVQDIMSGKALQDASNTIDAAANPYHRGSKKDDNYWKQVGQHFTDTGQDQKNGDYRTKEEKAASDAALATADLTNSLKGLSSASGSAAKKTETLADKITKADKALTESQNAYKTLNDAVQEYNDTGTISLATWQDLMDLAPEYQALLSKQGDQLVIDTAAYNELTAAQRMEIETLVTQNGVTADAIQLIDSLGIAAEDSANKAGTAFSDLKDKVKELVKDGPLEVITDLAGALKNGDWTDAAAAIAQGLWMTITPEQQDIIYKWATEAIKTMNDGFTKAGWSGLINAGTSVVQGLADSSTDMGGLIAGLLNQVGISGGIQGLLSTIAELAPLVLGVAAAAAAVAAGVMGVAAAFKYVISQSQLLQSEVQELADAGQALTDELSDALEVLQPVIDLSEEMLASLDRLTSTITDTITGIGVELMETLLPILTEIMDTLTPVAESLQPALEAVGDLLRTLLELFGTLVSSVLTALQPVLEAIGPLIEVLAIQLNTIATLVSAILSPALKALGEVLNWLLQPIKWVAEAIQSVATFIVNLLNSVLKFFGIKIALPDGSAADKGEAFDEITNALEDNTDALEENSDLIRNPPRYQTGGGGPTTGVIDYSAMLAAARAAMQSQNTRVVTNYDAGSGQTAARLNASWKGSSTTVLNVDGKEVARVITPYVDEDMAF